MIARTGESPDLARSTEEEPSPSDDGWVIRSHDWWGDVIYTVHLSEPLKNTKLADLDEGFSDTLMDLIHHP